VSHGTKARSFSDWLQGMCERGGIDAQRLHILYARAGGDQGERTVKRWYDGSHEPKAHSIRLLVKALSDAPELAGVNVWREFEEHMRSFRPAPRRAGAAA
jgi:hypothetical protein